ncbi:cation:proton antiporter [uncultured Erythrobacter sp.]|uniref:cation:proton antiporter domain-containing protein n=1 Tax=uncultured Erythrobacter sp. TaxID=263913 RepID=UPI002605F778|nr:cation:proton antiporter [uncultured Erythrobacter sp.]
MGDFLLLAFILLIAGVVAVPLATRFGLGSVLGYLLAGVAVSPTLRFLDVDVAGMQQFAEIGVVMMLFIIGLELEPKRLWQMRQRLLGLGGGQVLVTTLLIAGVSLMTGEEWRTAIAVGMILALSSTAIVLQTLEEKGLMRTQGGEASFSVLLVQDVAVILILALLPLLAIPELVEAASTAGENAADHGHGGLSLVEGLPAWLAGLITIGSVGLVVFIGAYLTRPVFRFIASAELRELFTAAALLFVIGIALLMLLVGLSPALGAFIAGVVLANSEYRHELEADISPFKGLLLGLFFITVGAGIDFSAAIAQFNSLLLWTTVLLGSKMVVLWIIAKMAGLVGQDRWLFTLGLAQAGEFGFVLIAYASGSAVLAPELSEFLLMVVAFSMLLTPLLFILFDKVVVPRFVSGESRESDAIDESNDIILAGRGRVGGLIDRILEAAGHQSTVIDYDSRHIEALKKFGVKSYFGDATRPDLLASAGIAKAKLLIVALDDKEQIDKLVSYAISNFPKLHVIVRAIDRDHVYRLWSLGCRDIIRETYDGSLRMGRSALEALGNDRQSAQAMVDAFEAMDRNAMIEVADLWRADVPAFDNEPLLARINELRGEWDRKLSEQMDAITKRGS